MKKKIIALLLCAAVTLSLTACGSRENVENPDRETNSTSDKADKDKDNNSDKNSSAAGNDPSATSADFFEYLKKDGAIAITKYTGSDKAVVIPRSINGAPVTLIDQKAFSDSEITSVTIPDGVTEIGNGAFFGCASLKNIVIPVGVTRIGDNAFLGCTELLSVTLPDSVNYIGSDVFSGCAVEYKDKTYLSDGYTALYNIIMNITVEVPSGSSSTQSIPTTPSIPETSADQFKYINFSTLVITKYIGSDTKVNIPSKINGEPVRSIGGEAFKDCTSLTSVTILDGVTSIGNYAFNFCTSLTSVTIPDSVTSIGHYAFNYCTSLTSVTIPDSVTAICSDAFNGCKCTVTYKGKTYTSDNYSALYNVI